MSQMYTQAKEIEQAYGTWKSLQKEGKTQDAIDYATDHRADLNKYHGIERIKKQEALLNQRIYMIERGGLDADTKRERIRAINVQKDHLARIVAN